MNQAIKNRQQDRIADLIKQHSERTKTSKQLSQTFRPFLADKRLGFFKAFKEVSYQLVVNRSLGSKIWDVDGNEYIDCLMAFGSSLLGHNPPFIKKAIAEQLELGIQVGTQPEIAGEVAQLICKMTGMERVAFSNTGTESVMTAIRLARTVTGRNKIAKFSGSYHGHFDGILAKAQKENGNLQGVPIRPGIPQSIVEDVLVLDYGSPESLEIIKNRADELGAVLVEPVQTSNPGFQPKEFLQELRELTKASGIALIFDEMVTGFRIHPGGAQAWFGVEADIATYGKIVGGGMPIGVIAGKAPYLDAIDGGMWSYGDESFPQAKQTFFAGTYCRHPLALAAGRAVLQHLDTAGPALQQQLNQRTSQFVGELNAIFAEQEVPIRMNYFGSYFDFVFANAEDALNDDKAKQLLFLYYNMMYKGIFLRGPGSFLSLGGFLSTAHTDADISYIKQTVKDSLILMRN